MARVTADERAIVVRFFEDCSRNELSKMVVAVQQFITVRAR
jgi:hypothetical protein